MKILLGIVFLSIVSFAKISSAIQNVGSVSISDILPNVAVKGESSQIVIKGSGFISTTKVIITPDTTHEVLKENIYTLPAGLAAQESYVYEDKLYIGYGDDSESMAGILVYDLLSDSKAPTLLYDNNETNLTYVNTMVMSTDGLYIGDDTGLFRYTINSTDGSLSNPTFYNTPAPVRKIKFYNNDIIISNSADNNESDSSTGIIQLNSSFVKQSDFNTSGSSWSFDISGDKLFIADGDNGVLVTNIDGSEPINYPTSTVHDIIVDGNYTYIAKFANGIEMLNTSNLSVIASYSTNGKSHKMRLINDRLVIANTEDGVLILDVEDKTTINQFAKFNAPGDTFSVDTYGNYGYSANGFNGIVISDISKPNSMDDMLLSSAKTDGYSNSVVTDGNISYFTYSTLGETNGGVVVTDLSKLEQPEYKTSFRPLFKTIANTEKMTITKLSDINLTIKEDINLQTVTFDGDNNRTMTTANQVFVESGLAYVADAYGLVIYDIENNISLGSLEAYDYNYGESNATYDQYYNSDPVSIQVVNDLNVSDTVYSKVAVMANHYGSVALFDVTDSSNPSYITGDILSEVYGADGYYTTNAIVKDGKLYISNYQTATDKANGWSNEILILELSTLTLLEQIETVENVNSIVFDSGYAYISAGYDGLIITPENNLSDILATYNTPDFAWFASIKENIAYIADSYTGIVMLDISDKSNPVYLDTLKVSGDTRDFDFIDSQAAMLVSSQFGGITTLDMYLDTNITSQTETQLTVTFPDYRILGDYNVKVVNDNLNYSRVTAGITLISSVENSTMQDEEVQNNLQLRTKDGKDGEVIVDGQSMMILNGLLSYNSTITNVFKELSSAEYQLTSSNKSIAQIFGNKIVFYNNGKVTVTISAKGLTDSITFTVKNIEPISVTSESDTDKLTDAQAVIIVGHIDATNSIDGLTVENTNDKLRFSINKIGNKLYKTLVKFGLSPEDIFYFNPNGAQKILDIDNNKKKDDVTYNNTDFEWSEVTTLVDSLENNSSRPLIFYMVDHGDVNEIKIAANKSVTATQIKTLFDDFQSNTSRKVVGIFDACYSGSIFDDLNNNTYGNRVIVSSADATNPTYMDPFGISFSKYLTKYMLKGDDLNSSFSQASTKFNKKLKKYGVSINPQYYSTSTNKQKISDYAITSGEPEFNSYTAKDENLSYVVTDNKFLTLDVNITLNYPTIAKAYALILSPVAPVDVGSAKIINSQKVALVYNATSGLFSGDYTFDTNGTYAINYLVEDDEDNMLLSDLAYVTIDKSATLSVASTKDNLTNTNILNTNIDLNNVITDLNLSTIGINQVVVSWESNNTSVISNNGDVTRSVFSDGNKTVTLTATMTSSDGNVTDTKVFTVIVVATDNNIPDAPNYTYQVKSGQTISGQLNTSDLDGDSVSFALVSNDLNGTLNFDVNSGSFTYNSNSDFSGLDSFTFSISDGIETSSVKKVTFIVSSDVVSSTSTDTTKTLYSGWNLIGLEDDTILTNENINSIYTYNDENWSSTTTNTVDSISTVKNSQGYWVSAKTDFSLTYLTAPTVLDISTLSSGWNLVSSKAITDINSKFSDSSIHSIWKWENNKWQFYANDASLTYQAAKMGFDTIYSIDDFDGFWVKVK